LTRLISKSSGLAHAGKSGLDPTLLISKRDRSQTLEAIDIDQSSLVSVCLTLKFELGIHNSNLDRLKCKISLVITVHLLARADRCSLVD